MIPTRPPECTCEYPATLHRTATQHAGGCPVQAVWQAAHPAAETPAQTIARLERENAALRDELRAARTPKRPRGGFVEGR